MWVETVATEKRAGRKMPLDADPANPARAAVVENGNLIITREFTADGTPIVRYVQKGRHVAHFATCPQAAQHRKPK